MFGWEIAVGAMGAVVASENAKKQAKAMRNPPILPYNQPESKQVASAKCPCCGSRQFVTHQSRRVCTYCRSEQDGQPVHTFASSDRVAALLADESKYLNMITGQYDVQFGQAVLRPEMAVRIAEI